MSTAPPSATHGPSEPCRKDHRGRAAACPWSAHCRRRRTHATHSTALPAHRHHQLRKQAHPWATSQTLNNACRTATDRDTAYTPPEPTRHCVLLSSSPADRPGGRAVTRETAAISAGPGPPPAGTGTRLPGRLGGAAAAAGSAHDRPRPMAAALPGPRWRGGRHRTGAHDQVDAHPA